MGNDLKALETQKSKSVYNNNVYVTVQPKKYFEIKFIGTAFSRFQKNLIINK